MDDFLHNLRSGKLKQSDRGRRDHGDYKGPQRRAGNERRRPDYYTKVTNENFALIKSSMDLLAENQKLIADAVTDQGKTGARIADALEAIATMLGHQLGDAEALPQAIEPDSAQPDEDAPDMDALAGNPTDMETEEPDNDDEPRLVDLISTMRSEGTSWEKIARHMEDQNIPTVSGKGKWRGQAVKKYWDANT